TRDRDDWYASCRPTGEESLQDAVRGRSDHFHLDRWSRFGGLVNALSRPGGREADPAPMWTPAELDRAVRSQASRYVALAGQLQEGAGGRAEPGLLEAQSERLDLRGQVDGLTAGDGLQEPGRRSEGRPTCRLLLERDDDLVDPGSAGRADDPELGARA